MRLDGYGFDIESTSGGTVPFAAHRSAARRDQSTADTRASGVAMQQGTSVEHCHLQARQRLQIDALRCRDAHTSWQLLIALLGPMHEGKRQ